MLIRRLGLCAPLLLAGTGCAKHEPLQYDPAQTSAIGFASHLVTEASSGLDKAIVSGRQTSIPGGQKFEVDFVPYAMKETGVANSMENYCRGRGGTQKYGSCRGFPGNDKFDCPSFKYCVVQERGVEYTLFAWNTQYSRSLRSGTYLIVAEPNSPSEFFTPFSWRGATEVARTGHLKARISDPVILEGQQFVVAAGHDVLVKKSEKNLSLNYEHLKLRIDISRLDDECMSVWYRVAENTPSQNGRRARLDADLSISTPIGRLIARLRQNEREPKMTKPTFWSEFKVGATEALDFYRSMLLAPYNGIREGLRVSKALDAEGRHGEAAIVLYFAPLVGIANALKEQWKRPKPSLCVSLLRQRPGCGQGILNAIREIR